MGRSPCCDKVGLKKGPWTPEEDQKLLTFIQAHGHGSWRALPAKAGLQRCGKSCRLRWTNYLRPDIKRGKFSLQEEQTIIQLHALLGNRWSAIATHLPKRTDNEIKNYWNTHLKKRLTKMGIDPVTHKPKHHEGLGSHAKVEAAHISHMAQWESARLEAEARLGKESKQVMMTAANPTQTRPHHHHHMTSHAHAGLVSRAPPALPCLDVLKAWRGACWSLTTKPATSTTIISNMNSTGMMSGSSSSMISAIDDLESPTSTLNFPHDPINTLSIPMQNALISTRFNGKDYEVPCQENNDVTFGDCTDASAVAAASSTWFVDSEETFTLPAGAFSDVIVEGLNDILVYNSEEQADQEKYVSVAGGEVAENGGGGGGDGSCDGGAFEENRSYWNSILSLVNASPAGSPMF